MKRHAKRSIRTRILAHMCVTFAVIICTAIFMVHAIMRHQLGVATAEATNRSIAAASTNIEHEMSVLKFESEYLSTHPGIRSIAGNEAVNSVSIADVLKSLKRSQFCDWYSLTDSRGSVRGSSTSRLIAGADLSGCSTISSAKVGIGRAGIEFIGGRPAVVSASPIRLGDYVLATVETGKWVDHSFVDNVAKSAGAVIAFTEGRHVIAASDTRLTSAPGQQSFDSLDLGDRSYVGSKFELPQTYSSFPIEGIALIPSDDVSRPFMVLTRGLIVLLVSSLIVLVLSSSAIAYSLAHPLQRLAEAAHEMAHGRWPERQLIVSDDEIGFLQRSFDEMALSIREGNERLLTMLHVDPLTELQNHRTFRESLALVVQESLAEERGMALVLIDLDGFEKFNQRSGPDMADGVLKDIARIVRRYVTDGQRCGRYGGNEFALIVDSAEGEDIAERVREQIHVETPVTASVGVALLNEQTKRLDLLVLAAEIAVSQAKEGGRNRVRVFESFDFTGDEVELQRFVHHSSYSAVKALAEAVDAKDEYTRGHSRRVAEYAASLAKALDYDDGFVNLVYTSGTLHDVGKIGVPDVVLKKTGRLTEQEFELIRKHPELGEKIVAQIPQLRDTLPGIRHHHERWDGKGYPDCIAGEAIPLVARILAVADSYDAMTSDRSYRKGMGHDVAIEQIIKGAGHQFDPELALKFVEVLNQEQQPDVPRAA